MKFLIIIISIILSIFFMYLGYINRLQYNKAKITFKAIHNVSDIKILKSSTVKPIIYTSVVSLKNLSGSKKKAAFVSIILPSILIIKQEIDIRREKVKSILNKYIQTKKDQKFLTALLKRYNAKNYTMLLKRMIMPPNSLIIAQAAIESGWGTSNFFVKGNNIFGVWSYNPKFKSLQASGTQHGRHVHVRKYNTIQQSIYSYLLTLASNPLYKQYRQALQITDNPYNLANKLIRYSQLREIYVKRLKKILRTNDLTKYDDYHLYMY